MLGRDSNDDAKLLEQGANAACAYKFQLDAYASCCYTATYAYQATWENIYNDDTVSKYK